MFVGGAFVKSPFSPSSWGSGADLWGSDSDSRFGKPRIDDGMLEVVGVTGVVHMVSESYLLSISHFPHSLSLSAITNANNAP